MADYRLRKVTPKDATILFEWTNDLVTRQNSFQTQMVVWDEHLIWLNRKLQDGNCFFYILNNGPADLGMVRLDYDEAKKEAMISFSISPKYRGNGLGTKILGLAEEKAYELAEVGKEVHLLVGEVKTQNYASKKCFVNNGYSLRENNQESYDVFVKSLQN